MSEGGVLQNETGAPPPPADRPEPYSKAPHLRQYAFKKGDAPRGAAVKGFLQVKKSDKKKDKPWPRRARKSSPQTHPEDFLPDGTHKQSAARDEGTVQEMRDHAAMIAVDMERQIYIDAKTGKTWSGGYSKTRIAQDMGFTPSTSHTFPKFMEAPDFERAVEWERIRRDATYRIALKEALPQTDVVLGGLLREAQRRVLSGEVRNIDDRVLFGELRQYMAMKAQHESALAPRGDIQITINDFRGQIDQLPAEARAVAMGLFENELRRLTDATKSIESGLEAPVVKVPGRKPAKQAVVDAKTS